MSGTSDVVGARRSGKERASHYIAFLSQLSRWLGRLPPNCGQWQLARVVQHLCGLADERVILTQTMSTGAVLNLDLSDPTQFLAYVMRRYQHDVFSAVVGLIRPGGVFFDVGAHVGLVSLPVAVARPDARVVAFEADRRNAELFRVNASLNPGCSVTLVEAAIGAEPGTASVVRGGDSGHSHIALSGEAGDRIPQITLDSYVAASDIEEVDVLKLDVEGFEPYVLQGARGLLLAGRVRAIVCEVLDPNLERFGFDRQSVVDVLRHHGFEQESIPPLGLGKLRGSSNRRPAPDLLFLRGGR